MKNQFKYYFPLILFSITSFNSLAQKTRKTPKFHIGIETHFGTTFPNFITEKEIWKPRIYSSWGGSLSVLMRFNKNWSGDIGFGIEQYTMVNRMPKDRYNLGFFSPSLSSGLQYAFSISKKGEGFFGVSVGAQVGYNEMLVEVFDTYAVIASSNNRYYYFIKPRLGIRKVLGKKKRKNPISCEYGPYFRYNFNGLGRAEFIHDNYVEILEPRGHVMGFSFKVLFPSSTTMVRIKTKERENRKKELDSTIFHPRF